MDEVVADRSDPAAYRAARSEVGRGDAALEMLKNKIRPLGNLGNRRLGARLDGQVGGFPGGDPAGDLADVGKAVMLQQARGD